MSDDKTEPQQATPPVDANDPDKNPVKNANGQNPKTGEVGGPEGPEPTRYGDWEKKGRCIDF